MRTWKKAIPKPLCTLGGRLSDQKKKKKKILFYEGFKSILKAMLLLY